MITIGLVRSKKTIKGFRVAGHARFRPRGEDIICAAVSVLSQTALLGLHDFAGIKIEHSIDRTTGSLKCQLPEGLDEKQGLMAETILETMVLGLKNLQVSYPDHIRIFRRRWT